MSNSVVLNQGYFCPPGNIGQCLQTFLVVKTEHKDTADSQWWRVKFYSAKGSSSQQRITQSRMPGVPPLRNPVLIEKLVDHKVSTHYEKSLFFKEGSKEKL